MQETGRFSPACCVRVKRVLYNETSIGCLPFCAPAGLPLERTPENTEKKTCFSSGFLFCAVPQNLLLGFAKRLSQGDFHAGDCFRDHTDFFWGAVGGELRNFILEHVSRLVNVSAKKLIR